MRSLAPWTKTEDASLATAFGGQAALDEHIARRVSAYMDCMLTGQAVATSAPDGAIRAAVNATGRNRAQVLNRLICITRIALGLSVAEHLRGPRRDVLRTYAARGIRTIDAIRAADSASEKPAEPTKPTTPMQEVLTYALGGADALTAYIDALAESNIKRMSGERAKIPGLPRLAVDALAHVHHKAVYQWLVDATNRRLGLDCDEPYRANRRRVLLDYARRGIVTMAAVDAADAGDGTSAAKPAEPAAKPRTLDDIANELREAREEAARLSVAAAHAEKRMDELRAELTRAVEEV